MVREKLLSVLPAGCEELVWALGAASRSCLGLKDNRSISGFADEKSRPGDSKGHNQSLCRSKESEKHTPDQLRAISEGESGPRV